MDRSTTNLCRVVRGNLLVIPIQESLIYVEPLYLQAEQGKIPELKKVIVYYSDPQSQEEYRVVMRPTLDEALRDLFEPQERDPLEIKDGSGSESDSSSVVSYENDTSAASVQNLNRSMDDVTYLRQLEQRALNAHRLLAELVVAQQSGDDATHRLRIQQLTALVNDMRNASIGGGQSEDPDAAPVDGSVGGDSPDAEAASMEDASMLKATHRG